MLRLYLRLSPCSTHCQVSDLHFSGPGFCKALQVLLWGGAMPAHGSVFGWTELCPASWASPTSIISSKTTTWHCLKNLALRRVCEQISCYFCHLSLCFSKGVERFGYKGLLLKLFVYSSIRRTAASCFLHCCSIKIYGPNCS